MMVTPDSDLPEDLPETSDRLPRLSRRAIVLGSVGVLAAGAAVAAAGFFGAGGAMPRTAPEAASVDIPTGQLGTLSLHDEKTMRAIGKGVILPHHASPTPSTTP